MNNIKKLSALTLVCAAATVGAQAQTVIDPLNGTGGISYTTYLILNSAAGDGVSFSQGTGSLVATATGTTSAAEQALYLAPASSFSTTFSVGSTLEISTTVPTNSTAEDIGLAISASNPSSTATIGGNGSRLTFDYATISVRPSQTAIRQNTSINGVLTSASDVVSGIDPTSVLGLYITWASGGGSNPNVFDLGYITSAGLILDDAVTFSASSTIGAEIGSYSDIRTLGANIGSESNLTIVPEPSSLALCGMGALGLVGMIRRKK